MLMELQVVLKKALVVENQYEMAIRSKKSAKCCLAVYCKEEYYTCIYTILANFCNAHTIQHVRDH